MTESSIHLVLLKLFLSVLLLLGSVLSEIDHETVKQTIEETEEQKLETSLNKDCVKSYSATCLKLDMVSFLDKLSEQKSIGIIPGVSVVKENVSSGLPASEIVANLARDFPNDVDKRLDAYLVHKMGAYLNSHSITIKLFDAKTLEAARNFNEEALVQFGMSGTTNGETARRKNKGNGMGTLAAGLMMMKGTLGALGFGALAMLAGKALMTGLMALMLSAIVGLKSLSGGGGDKKTTYEVISKPVYSSAHTHSSEEHHAGHGYGHSGYGRSLDLELMQEGIRKYGNVRNRRAF